jgi:hypothetical protein
MTQETFLKASKDSNNFCYSSTVGLKEMGVPPQAALDVLMGVAQGYIQDGYIVTMYNDDALELKDGYQFVVSYIETEYSQKQERKIYCRTNKEARKTMSELLSNVSATGIKVRSL